MKTINKTENRYRSISVSCWNFPNEIDLDLLAFVGYVKNNGISKAKCITIWNFDAVSFLKRTTNGFIHCVGVIGKESFQIILQ